VLSKPRVMDQNNSGLVVSDFEPLPLRLKLPIYQPMSLLGGASVAWFPTAN
jgi:hypothetical protein